MNEALALTVGCTFGLDSVQPAVAILQVAPYLEAGISVAGRALGRRTPTTTRTSTSTATAASASLLPAGASTDHATRRTSCSPSRRTSSCPERPRRRSATSPTRSCAASCPSRFCLPDELGHEAWQRFGDHAPGWQRVQAIVDYVHGHLEWVEGASNPWTTAADAYRAGQGVCRDFAHLAITFCRALNIPARYVFGYIPNIDVPVPPEAMDFAAWFEVCLDGEWHTFDARNNVPRTGRVVVGRGRDAVDVALITSFGPLNLTHFEVRAEPTQRSPTTHA